MPSGHLQDLFRIYDKAVFIIKVAYYIGLLEAGFLEYLLGLLVKGFVDLGDTLPFR